MSELKTPRTPTRNTPLAELSVLEVSRLIENLDLAKYLGLTNPTTINGAQLLNMITDLESKHQIDGNEKNEKGGRFEKLVFLKVNGVRPDLCRLSVASPVILILFTLQSIETYVTILDLP